MFILFLLLSILMLIEASTSLSRLTGYLLKTPESGLILQSSLSLISRMVMFLFMPFLGYLSDKQTLTTENATLIFYSFLMPLSLILLHLINGQVMHIYTVLIKRISEHGSLFHGVSFFKKTTTHKNLIFKKTNSLNNFYFLTLLAYVPYYLAWPIVIILLDAFHDQRAMILGMSSVFNGVNTIILTVFIDPKLIKIGKYKRILPSVYFNLIKMRIIASLLSILVLSITYLVLK